MFKDFNVEKVLDYQTTYVHKSKVLYSFSKLGKEIEQPHIYSYAFNSDGFRSIELNTKTEIVALGCSHTFGTGLPIEFNWVNQLGSMMSKEIINISFPGISVPYLIDTFYNLYYKEKINPKILLCNFPNFSRYRKYLFDTNLVFNEGSNMGHKDMEQNLLHIIQSIEATELLELFCKKNNIKLFWTVWEFSLGQKTMNEFLVKHYKNFYHDNYTDIFETMNRFVKVNSKGDLELSYKPEPIWNDTHEILYCHQKEKEIYKDFFYTALDRYDLPKKYQERGAQEDLSPTEVNGLKKYISKNKDGFIHGSHHGWHRHHHWALFFYDLIKDLA